MGLKQLLVIGAAGCAALGAVGCGDSGGSSATAARPGAQSSSDYVKQAQKITAEAEKGLIYSAVNEFTAGDDLELMTSWLGPTQSPPVPKGKSIAFVSCGA